jgi:hypothetical protein
MHHRCEFIELILNNFCVQLFGGLIFFVYFCKQNDISLVNNAKGSALYHGKDYLDILVLQ